MATTTYLGFDVLLDEPGGENGNADSWGRPSQLIASPVGALSLAALTASPALRRGFRWHLYSNAEVAAVRDFVDARKGRAVPFWLPSTERDLTLATEPGGPSTTITVQACGYTSRIFPAGPYRRHLMIRAVNGSSRYMRKVTGSVDNGNGTETLTLDTLANFQAVNTHRIGFMRLCRLAQDQVDIEWLAPQYAVATFEAEELPGEVPA